MGVYESLRSARVESVRRDARRARIRAGIVEAGIVLVLAVSMGAATCAAFKVAVTRSISAVEAR